MQKVLALIVFVMAVPCGSSYAELYQFTDKEGNIHITDNLAAVPAAQRPRTGAANHQGRRDAIDISGSDPGRNTGSSGNDGEKARLAAPVNSSSSQTLPAKNETGFNANVRS